MIKVVEVISDTNIGGAGRLLLSRIKYSNKKRFKYIVILPKDSLLSPLLKNAGASIIEIEGCRDKSFDLKVIISLYKTIKFISPSIVNSHACISARIASKLAGVKVNLCTRHCAFPIKSIYLLPFVKKISGFINSYLSDGVIAVSNSARENLLQLGINDKKIKVIINGAEKLSALPTEEKKKIKAGLKIPAESIVVSIFARLESYKDHKTFLCASNVLKNNENIHFLVVGMGSLGKSLREYAQKIGVKENVRFLGFVDDVSNIMNITDINVNCSIGTETSCLALSEGMSLGIPAIASDYSGKKYIVKNKVNGLIFSQKNHIALAKSILLLVNDKKLYSYLSQNAKNRFINELNAERMTLETERYYLSMLKKKKSSIYLNKRS